ncbi:hypothetical protein RW1_031_00220 [Rhodococcus wratislaviensis NBRC 100605]|uniref:Uncharacterized protein n=1 Tax=Rhodococcus wratislaviensis NBRC 100605 TaxID=1219028 RepID=X0Q6W0_RHOWR|nr:hypothetical protein RW1_031_00220 [Rhodococcus wratislaviensis NBRC 100605]
MWNSLNDNDILDFALLWDPLGGPFPENVANAFSIDMSEYNYRLLGAARFQLARLGQGTPSPGRIYGLSALEALARDPSNARHRTSPDLELSPVTTRPSNYLPHAALH